MPVVNGVYNLTLHQGSTFELSITLTGFDLTDLGVRAQLREKLNSTTPTNFVCTVMTLEPSGIIKMSLDSVATAGLKANIEAVNYKALRTSFAWDALIQELSAEDKKKYLISGREPYYWDLEVYELGSPEVVNRFLTGRVLVTTEVTR
jgi:hypothetical protein